MKRGHFADGCADYLKRIQRLAATEVVEMKDSNDVSPANRQSDESARLFDKAEGKVVVLDERGAGLDSSAMAAAISEWENRGVSRVSFLVGGPNGHAPSARERADVVWKLSDLTFPHELARLVLLEQLYRIETIRAGHPYHKA